MRVVSLIASSTEIVCALGKENLLVGRSHECDYPESVKKLPVTTEIKFIADGTSYEIDQRVKAILQEGLSVYRVKADLLKLLNPDVIITQVQCEVCAVSLRDVEEATQQWLGFKPRIVSLYPNCLEDLWTDIRKVALALNSEEEGLQLISQLKTRVNQLQIQAGALSGQLQQKPKVACIEWIDPLMAAGNWVPELVTFAGGQNLFGTAGKHSPALGWEELVETDPDIIIIMPCGFDISRTQREMIYLTQRPNWKSLKAVKNNCVILTDGNQYFNRPGPRLIESLEILIEIFYPDRSREKFRSQGWIHFPQRTTF
jgi:iron complex transport system substrate-binding protein